MTTTAACDAATIPKPAMAPNRVVFINIFNFDSLSRPLAPAADDQPDPGRAEEAEGRGLGDEVDVDTRRRTSSRGRCG